MKWQTVCLQDVKAQPWRNGGGTTRELVAWPDAKQWRWRASVAEVEQPGPFSSFPGVQRWFAVLSGDGVKLTINGHAQTLQKTDAPFHFDGAAHATCELLGGTTQDFNLMVQEDASARMQRIRGFHQVTINTPKTVALYAINTPAILLFGTKNIEMLPNSLVWMCVDTPVELDVRATDALLMEIDV